MLSGDNGILQKATTAKTETEKSQEQEIVALAYNSALAKKVSNGDSTAVTAGDLNTELTNQGATAIESNPIKVTFTVSKRQYTINSNGEITYAGIKNGDEQDDNELPTALGTKPYFPSDKFKQLEGTDLTTGLVITDKADNEDYGNEYVWIEVPSTAVDNTATGGPDYSRVSGVTDYTNIATSLRDYCKKDASNGNLITVTEGTEETKDFKTTTVGCTDTYYEGCGLADSETYTTLYNKMLKSVYENGGFWIGRYEAGAENARKSGDSSSGITPLSKIDQYPINFLTCGEAQTIAGNVPNKGSYNSSLMFGIQWDLVLRHLSNKQVATNLLTRDSTTWGNYRDSVFSLKKGSYYDKQSGWTLSTTWKEYNEDETGFVESSEKKSQSSNGNGILYTAGATTKSIQKNIYDLAGNVNEWTLEYCPSYPGYTCVFRGGAFNQQGTAQPSSYRMYCHPNINFDESIGFRVSIY